jgi:hypothetical protein
MVTLPPIHVFPPKLGYPSLLFLEPWLGVDFKTKPNEKLIITLVELGCIRGDDYVGQAPLPSCCTMYVARVSPSLNNHNKSLSDPLSYGSMTMPSTVNRSKNYLDKAPNCNVPNPSI